jgi:hypothetical protein
MVVNWLVQNPTHEVIEGDDKTQIRVFCAPDAGEGDKFTSMEDLTPPPTIMHLHTPS